MTLSASVLQVISARGLQVIKEFEGLRLKAYVCAAGKWTIGYGHTAEAGPPSVTPGMQITREQAFEILKRDIASFERDVRRLVRRPLTQGQFDALVSFHFNTGKLGGSTLLKRINAGRLDDVPAQLMRWTKARDPKSGRLVELAGLVRRRRAEAGLWRSLPEGPLDITAGRGDVAEVEETRSEKPAAESWSFWSVLTSIFGGGLTLPFGIDNMWAFAAVVVLVLVLGAVAFMMWTGRLTINATPEPAELIDQAPAVRAGDA